MSMIHDDDPGLRVPKPVVTVELLLFGRRPERAHVFVAAGEGGAAVRNAVVDLLEKEHGFVPTQTEHDRTPQLVNKESLVWVAVPADVGATAGADEEDGLYEYRHEVRVELMGGGYLAGELLYSLPGNHARVADYLNAPGRFFRLWAGGRLHLVNKTFVERVVEAPLELDTDPNAVHDAGEE
jgi:hypothetical protein